MVICVVTLNFTPLLVVLVNDSGSSVILVRVIGCARYSSPNLSVRNHD